MSEPRGFHMHEDGTYHSHDHAEEHPHHTTPHTPPHTRKRTKHMAPAKYTS